MRFTILPLAFVFFVPLAGCGDKSGPVVPAQVTPEQEQQMREAQQKVDVEERQHQTQQGANRALTPQQQVEMQERAHQGR